MAELLSMADIGLVAVKWCLDLLLHPHRFRLPELPFSLPLALALSLDFDLPFSHELLLSMLLLSVLLLPMLLFPVLLLSVLLLPMLLFPVLLLPVLLFPVLLLSVLLLPMLLLPESLLHIHPLELSRAFALNEDFCVRRLQWLGYGQWARISKFWNLAGRRFLRQRHSLGWNRLTIAFWEAKGWQSLMHRARIGRYGLLRRLGNCMRGYSKGSLAWLRQGSLDWSLCNRYSVARQMLLLPQWLRRRRLDLGLRKIAMRVCSSWSHRNGP